MKIYISGISGTGMGPLALMAKDAGLEVVGSDLKRGAIADELEKAGIEVFYGAQDGAFLKAHTVDWFVHTSALPEDHAELLVAKEMGLKITKRDELTAFLIEKLGLKMVAVAGTHGKTTTTSMITFGAIKLGIPAAYIVGTILNFAPSGSYRNGDKFFIYEADEYDRNFLKFHPWLAVFPAISYDHPDIYPTHEDYISAFNQFKSQCENTIEDITVDTRINLAGESRRFDATLALKALKMMAPEVSEDEIVTVLNDFPGVGRRFEKVTDGAYTDYAHHPEEIVATLETANEEAARLSKKGVVAVYQPHQNTRQHEVREGYKDAFLKAAKVFWLPTYLTRENPDLEIIAPADFINDLLNSEIAEPAEMSDELAAKIKAYLNDNYLVMLMTAGPADEWFRNILNS